MKEKQYAELITKTHSGIVNILEIIIHDTEVHNFHTLLLDKHRLVIKTAQTESFKSSSGRDFEVLNLSGYEKIWYNGTLVYKSNFWNKVKYFLGVGK